MWMEARGKQQTGQPWPRWPMLLRVPLHLFGVLTIHCFLFLSLPKHSAEPGPFASQMEEDSAAAAAATASSCSSPPRALALPIEATPRSRRRQVGKEDKSQIPPEEGDATQQGKATSGQRRYVDEGGGGGRDRTDTKGLAHMQAGAHSPHTCTCTGPPRTRTRPGSGTHAWAACTKTHPPRPTSTGSAGWRA